MSQPLYPSGEPAASTVAASSALEGLSIARGAPLGDARLSSLVATSLRAALDLVLGGASPLRPISALADDAALEVRCAIAHPEALELSGGLLESIEGSLTRAGGGRAEWVLRVPLAVPRPLFLMLAQGTLGLAVPWHSVLRVRLVPPAAIEATARREGAVVIPPFVHAADDAAERPVVLIALGLKRAFLVADRLIWRMPADPIEGLGVQGGPSLTRAVSTTDGEVFWVVDPADVMRDVEISPLGPPPIVGPPVPPARPVMTSPRRVTPVPLARSAAGSRERPVLRLVELKPEDVEPIGTETGPEATMPPATAPPPAPAQGPDATPALTPAATPEPVRAPAPDSVRAHAPAPQPAATFHRALVAEESIVGRMFLARLLERRGFVVEMVTSARELEVALRSGPWTLVLADVELPDSSRAEHLRRHSGTSATWVALVRDRADQANAFAAGVHASLRMPFEAEALDRLLPTLFPPGTPS